jgi:hypothetical protein
MQSPLDLAVRAAVEAHIGKTTCQVIELNEQLQMAMAEIARLTALVNTMAEKQAGNGSGGLAD